MGEDALFAGSSKVAVHARSCFAKANASADDRSGPLGAFETWPASLKNAFSLLINACCPMLLVWDCAPDQASNAARLLFYNDAYSALLPNDDFAAFGQSMAQCGTVANSGRSTIEQVFATGKPLHCQYAPLWCPDPADEPRYTWAYSAIWNEIGQIGGVWAIGQPVASIRSDAAPPLGAGDIRFRHIANYAPMMIWISDPNGRGVWFNQQWCQFTGQALEEALGSGWLSALHPEDALTIEQTCLEAHQQRAVVRLEYRLQRHDGVYRWVFDAAVPWFDDRGTYLGYIGSIIDITDRREAERDREQLLQELLAERTRFEAVLRQMPEGVIIADAATERMILANERTSQILQHSFELHHELNDYDQAVPFQAYHADGRMYAPEEYPLMRSLQTGEVVTHEEMDIHHQNGHRTIIDANSAPIFNQHGQLTSAVVVLQDITERKQVEQALRQSEERLRLAQQAAGAGLWDWDICRNTVTWSEEYYQLYGLNQTVTASYENWLASILADDRAATDRAARQALVEQTNLNVEFRIDHPTRGIRWITAIGQTFYDAAGQPVRMTGIALDITDRKQAEAEREQSLVKERVAREEAEQANRIKDEFLAVLSHELRSPLNPILGWARLLQTRQFDEATKQRALETIERNAKLQTQLIDDLLDVSRILRGKMTLTVHPVNLTTVVDAALETVRLSAEAKNIDVVTLIEGDIGLVAGDESRLQQVIWNLLSNAVKFTPAGGQITIKLNQIATQVRIQVQDTGKGIAPAFLPYVFEYFRQEDGTTTRQFGGLGLGLAIVRYLVEQHGGTVTADSPGEGLGATFTVQLPLLNRNETSNENAFTWQNSVNSTFPLAHLRILVLDDDVDMRDLIVTVLAQTGAETSVVTTAAEAWEALITCPPDILISDIGMPIVDGYQLIRRVRRLPTDQGGQIPAIALTAYASESDRQQALAAGFQLHIAKPVEPEALIRAIETLVKSTRRVDEYNGNHDRR